MAPPTIASLSTAKKLAFIVPSTNTAVETLTISLLHSLQANIIPLFTRTRVLTLGTDSSSTAQFTPAAFTAAAQLLADAAPDAIIWNGTSGMFVGGDVAADKALAKTLTDACNGISCSTNTLATIAALEYFSIRDISIAVPYTPDVTQRVSDFFTREGYRVHKALRLEETPPTNDAIGKCSAAAIKDLVRRAVTPETKAVLVACTNFPATLLVGELERELGVVVLDSIAVSAWYGLKLLGVKGTKEKMEGWGRLLCSL
ncbi:hypothetical protein M409DRAFT_58856 [Zasmidium cellare ATCC 36951]|uniref:Asp/Glu racemase n=1 Tax=Zasmidium cellare ATCC 36951 TaxID=1080233 RepID=A0A6A6C6E7_ZASCE|nr:uncharacterized protein M409DRAFT_58856 [Zasmidium cellare ATCC 36951]KAF2161780.1 hypothetical protein M409DRAFT_58856 [Zasmidium cellare ATCC 36951]